MLGKSTPELSGSLQLVPAWPTVLRAWSDFGQREGRRTQDEDAWVSLPRGAARTMPLGGSGNGKATINSFTLQMCAEQARKQEPRSVVGPWDQDLCLLPRGSPSGGEDRHIQSSVVVLRGNHRI